MRLLPSSAVALALLAVPPALLSQEPFIDAAPSCSLDVRERAVRDGVARLQRAVEEEREDRRAGRWTEARDALEAAAVEHPENPAAWYYLGRFYVAQQDVRGADSAFARVRRVLRACGPDIDQHVTPMQQETLGQAFTSWQGGQPDSAAALFQLAGSLMPRDANVPYLLAEMYAGLERFDSAAKYIRLGDEAAGGDPQYARRRERTLLEVARVREQAALEGGALQRVVQARLARDSLARQIARDSTLLAGLIAEWGGQRLRPDVQQRVSRDSTTLARRLESARRARAANGERLAQDSTAAAPRVAAAAQAYRTYLAVAEGDARAATQLLHLQSALGDDAGTNAAIDRLARIPDTPADDLVQAGVAVFNEGNPAAAARLLNVVRERNAYHRTALFVLSRAYYALRDAERLTAAARRLVEVDPLNPESVRMMAAAFELAGNDDSTKAWVALADGGVGLAVNVTQFVPAEASSTVNATARNVARQPSAPTTLVFEFLDAQGQVVATGNAAVPALQPGQVHPVSVRVEQGGAVGWRYRRRS